MQSPDKEENSNKINVRAFTIRNKNVYGNTVVHSEHKVNISKLSFKVNIYELYLLILIEKKKYGSVETKFLLYVKSNL